MASTQFVRTEDDILSKRPIVARFGSVDYEIPILGIKAARSWRDKFVKEAMAIGESLGQPAEAGAFSSGFAFVFLQFPEKIADLVFSYAPSLPREVIEGTEAVDGEGTEEQLAVVFSRIIQVAFPFVSELNTMTKTLASVASSLPSARSTK